MFPLGHVGLTVLLARLSGRQVPAWALAPFWALAVGAMLPDLLDKPLGHVLLGWGNGRIFFHGALFALAVTASALAVRRLRPAAFPIAAALALGCWTHLAFDRLWENPQALLFPLLGTEFPHHEFAAFTWVQMLLADPYTQITEALGACALAWMAWQEGWFARVGLRRRAPDASQDAEPLVLPADW